MEIWDILDENANKTGKTIEKTDRLPDGLYHLGVDVWIKNDEGKYLIQKRSAAKKRMPGKWITTGGSVLSGERGMEAVVRETAEEIGVEVNTLKLTLLFKNRFNNCINEVWLLHQNVEISAVHLQPNEVSEVKWASNEEIMAMMANGEMVHCGAAYMNAVFEEVVLKDMLIEE